MPIYEYRCAKCKYEFSVLMGYSDPCPTCPECGNLEVVKKMSMFASFSSNPASTRSIGGGCTTCNGGTCSTCEN